MKAIFWATVLTTLHLSFCYTDGGCKKQTSHLAAVRLRDDLLCDYDKFIRPVVNQANSTVVTVRMILKFFEYEMHSNTLSVHNWLSIYWKDEHLKWNPTEYESINQTYLSSEDIWVPDLSIYNMNDLSGSPSAFNTVRCLVTSKGVVICVPSNRHDALCMADLTKYPFDQQNCTLKYGSWVHSGEEVDFRTASPPVSISDYIPNSDWKLITVTIQRNAGHYNCCPDNTYPSLNYKFQIQRNSATHAASIIIPSLVLIAITLTTLWMNPEQMDRMCLACINLIAHILHLQLINFQIPSTGNKPPLLVLYSRDSLLLCTFSIVLTVILKAMICSVKSSPAWVSSLVSGILSNRPGQWFLLYESSLKGVATARKDEDTVNIVEASESVTNTDWKMFAKLLDRLSFIAFMITYIFMFISFVL